MGTLEAAADALAERDLAEALRGVTTHLDRPGGEQEVGEVERKGGRACERDARPRRERLVSMSVAHVQATAVDALRSLGVERLEAYEEIGEVARAAQLDGAELGSATSTAAGGAASRD